MVQAPSGGSLRTVTDVQRNCEEELSMKNDWWTGFGGIRWDGVFLDPLLIFLLVVPILVWGIVSLVRRWFQRRGQRDGGPIATPQIDGAGAGHH